MDEFRTIVDTLRGDHGCDWDKAQTHESLKKYLIEETGEVLRAEDQGDDQNFCEELGDLLLFSGEIWDASLLYSQVEKAYKNDVIGAQAKFKNAQLSYYNNDFEWAKSQLDVLRASTSKLIANDAMQLSLLISDNMEDDSTYDMLSLFAAAVRSSIR